MQVNVDMISLERAADRRAQVQFEPKRADLKPQAYIRNNRQTVVIPDFGYSTATKEQRATL